MAAACSGLYCMAGAMLAVLRCLQHNVSRSASSLFANMQWLQASGADSEDTNVLGAAGQVASKCICSSLCRPCIAGLDDLPFHLLP